MNNADEVLKTTESPRIKPTIKVRINPNPNRNNNPVLAAIKEQGDQINALQRSVAYITSRLSKLDHLATREREQT